MPKFTHIVELFLWDRPGWDMPKDYLMYRLEFFKKYTLNSLLCQTNQDFKIFLQLGQKFKKITDKYELHPNVIKCYDHGQSEYKKIKTPFLVISRLDSDDMFRRTAIQAIRNGIDFNPEARTVAKFSNNICWDKINECIMPHKKSTSPFFTHVFPKEIYGDWSVEKWEEFKEQHFCAHGNHGAGDRRARELASNQVCVIKHGQNVSHMKRDRPPFVLTEDQKETLKELGKSDSVLLNYDNAIWDPPVIRKILKKFGVKDV